MNKKIAFYIIPLFFFLSSCSDDENFNVTGDDLTPTGSRSITQDILKLVNEHRQTINISNLSRNTTADSLAIEHTNYMISEKSIGHDNFDERFTQLQLKENAQSAAENVAYNYPTAEAVVEGWLDSPDHRTNIEGNYTHIGIAAIQDNQGRYYFTQLFYR